MKTTSSPAALVVFYEHSAWFEPLFSELERREIPFVRWKSDEHDFDPGTPPTVPGIVFNRMSPSAWQRGQATAIHYTSHLLRYLEDSDVRVLNGVEAWRTEISKAHQISLLRSLGLPYPETRVVHGTSRVLHAAEGLRFPIVVKPNVGGSGAGVRRFDSLEELAQAVPQLDFGIDGTGLVQEFIPPRDGHIVRIEILGGRFLYGIAVHPPEHGFNLCPADACVGADGEELTRTFCAADAPDTGLRVEAFTPSVEIQQQVEALTAAAGIEIGGVEYVIDDRDGQLYYYDVNAMSNFVADAGRVIGFDPFERLVDWLETELDAAAPQRLGALPAGVA